MAALRHATILLPDAAARELVLGRLEAAGVAAERRSDGMEFAVDPSGNRLLLDVRD
jgi:hypothetical protein